MSDVKKLNLEAGEHLAKEIDYGVHCTGKPRSIDLIVGNKT